VSVIHNLITSIWNKEELPDHWKKSIIVPIHKIGDKTDCNNYRGYHCYQLHTKFHQISFFHIYVHTLMKLLGTISMDFNVTDLLLRRFSAFVRYWKKVGVQ
jgi:hypothetical protein